MDAAPRRSPDVSLFAATVALIGIGIVMIYSASAIVALDWFGDSAFFLKRQLLWSVLGLGVMSVSLTIHYQRLRRVTPATPPRAAAAARPGRAVPPRRDPARYGVGPPARRDHRDDVVPGRGQHLAPGRCDAGRDSGAGRGDHPRTLPRPPPHGLPGPLAWSAGQRLSHHPVAAGAGVGWAFGRGAGSQPAEVLLPARAAHRLHFCDSG